MGEVSDIADLLAQVRVERRGKRSDWTKAVIVAVISVAVWVFELGRSETEYVKRPEMVKECSKNADPLVQILKDLQSHSERITSLETEIRVRTEAVEPAPIKVKGKKQ